MIASKICDWRGREKLVKGKKENSAKGKRKKDGKGTRQNANVLKDKELIKTFWIVNDKNRSAWIDFTKSRRIWKESASNEKEDLACHKQNLLCMVAPTTLRCMLAQINQCRSSYLVTILATRKYP